MNTVRATPCNAIKECLDNADEGEICDTRFVYLMGRFKTRIFFNLFLMHVLNNLISRNCKTMSECQPKSGTRNSNVWMFWMIWMPTILYKIIMLNYSINVVSLAYVAAMVAISIGFVRGFLPCLRYFLSDRSKIIELFFIIFFMMISTFQGLTESRSTMIPIILRMTRKRKKWVSCLKSNSEFWWYIDLIFD